MKKPARIIFVTLIFLLTIITAYTIQNNSKQGEAQKEFKQKFESYAVVKDFIIQQMQENEQLNIVMAVNGNMKWYYYFSEPDSSFFSESYDISDKNVAESLDLLSEIENTSLDLCRGRLFEGYEIIDFVYDWEHAFCQNYNIYWCKDYNVLKSYLKNIDKEYNLKKLKDNWYYVGWKE